MLYNSLIRSAFFKFLSKYSFCNSRFREFSLSSGSNISRKTHYDVLGLKQNASSADIRAAFVKLSKEIHPDKNPNDPHNHSKFIMLNEAYTILSKPQSRKEYDVSLAHWLHVQQTMARAGYTSHTTGDKSTPGFSSRPDNFQGSDQQRIFWDETIWYMRDRSKDSTAFYNQNSYYGIRGIRRQSNSVIVAVCLVIIACGFVYFYAAFRYTKRKQQLREIVDRRNMMLLNEAKERAKVNGIAKQLEIFDAKQSALKNSSIQMKNRDLFRVDQE